MVQETSVRQRLRMIFDPLNSLDKQVTEKLSVCAESSSVCGKWRVYMKALEISCHGIPWLGGCLIFLWCSSNHNVREIIFNILIALVLDLVIVALTKAFVRRGRPQANTMDMFVTIGVDNYAFPSGHASRATMLTCLIYSRNFLGIIGSLFSISWAFSVCVSRVLLGRHHVGDVLVGFLLGVCEAGLMEYIWFNSESTQQILEIFFEFESFHSGDM